MMTDKRTIVVMDDSSIVLDATRAVLEANGYAVRAASNLAELETALTAVRPDLLVLDVQMPEMFGDDVAQVLRHVRSLAVPIVLFSDIDEKALADRAREAGVDGCVTKRAGMPALLAKVAQLTSAT